jgi:hypothetical protein
MLGNAKTDSDDYNNSSNFSSLKPIIAATNPNHAKSAPIAGAS